MTIITVNPYESSGITVDSGLPGRENDPAATLHRYLLNGLSLCSGCILGAYTGVAMAEGPASAVSRGIPPLHIFAPVCAIAIAATSIWRWCRFGSSGLYGLGPIAKFIGGVFATCLTYLIMTQLDASNLIDSLLPWILLPIFLAVCLITVEIEAAMEWVFNRRRITDRL